VQLLYAWQWVAFHLGIIITVPVVLGSALNLDAMGVASLTQRVFLLAGIASLVQVLFGHRLILVEGPAAPWWAAYVILADLAVRVGGSIEVFRTDLQGAMLVVGALLMLAGAFGLIRRLLPFFTPPITGTILMLLALQIGGVGLRGILSFAPGQNSDVRTIAIAVIVVISIVFLSMRAKGVLKNGAVIFGILIGWAIYYLWGFSTPAAGDVPLIMLPGVFPWGAPTFNPGVTASLVLLGLVLVPNIVASITAMENVLEIRLPEQNYDRGLFATGLSNLLAGFGGSSGSIPFAISAGLVAISGVKSRLPFILGCFIFIILGIFPVIGKIVASIPPPVANAVLLVSASPLAVYALKDYARCRLENRDIFVIGLSLMVGVGVMAVPGESWYHLPQWAANILGNGVITGSFTCILMEHLILPQRPHGKVNIKA